MVEGTGLKWRDSPDLDSRVPIVGLCRPYGFPPLFGVPLGFADLSSCLVFSLGLARGPTRKFPKESWTQSKIFLPKIGKPPCLGTPPVTSPQEDLFHHDVTSLNSVVGSGAPPGTCQKNPAPLPRPHSPRKPWGKHTVRVRRLCNDAWVARAGHLHAAR